MGILNRGKWFYFVLLSLIFLKSSLLYIIISSYGPIQIEFSLNKTSLGLIATIYYLFSFIGSILWTYLYRSVKKHTILLIGSIIWLSGILLLCLSPMFWQILLSISLIGLGAESLSIISLNIFISLLNNENRGKGLSLYYLTQGSGGVFGSLFVGIAEGIYNYSWKYLIGIMGIFSTIIFVIILFYFRSRFNKVTNVNIKINENSGISMQFNGKLNKDILKNILNIKANVVIFTFLLLMITINVFNNIWIQKYWIEIHNISQTMASISLIFTSAGEFLGLYFGGWLIDKLKKTNKYSTRKLIKACYISVLFFLVGYSLSWTIDVTPTENMNFVEICWYMFITAFSQWKIFISYISLFLAFFLLQILGPIPNLIIIENNSEKNTHFALNCSIIIINLGWLFGPILGGYLADIFDLKFVLLLFPVVFSIMLIYLYYGAKYFKN